MRVTAASITVGAGVGAVAGEAAWRALPDPFGRWPTDPRADQPVGHTGGDGV